jgi:ATP-binding cassette subfamily C protein
MHRSSPAQQSELRAALRASRRAFAGVGILSAGVNILALTGSIYMLQLYDRVLPAHSVPTLVGLTLIMLLLYAGFGVFDFLRAQVLSRIGVRFERALRERVFSAVLLKPLRATGTGDGLQPVRDLDQMRGFLAGPGPTALLDLPWLPFYLGLVWFLHPMLGLLGTAGSIVLFGLALLTETKTRTPARELSEASGARQSFGEAARRNAEAVHALGMGPRMAGTWTEHSERLLTHQVGTTDVASVYGSLSKVLRMVLQSAILGLGAYLVIRGEATAGVMIAASILVSRALAPVEVAIANWRGFVAARQGFQRLEALLAGLPAHRVPTSLPAPSQALAAEAVWIAAPPGSHAGRTRRRAVRGPLRGRGRRPRPGRRGYGDAP